MLPTIVLVGRPNVGKSSIINALTRSQRVIVSPIPGTTRDSVDVPFEVETDGAFDPHTQEALLAQPSDAAEGTVIQVLQKGYRLGERVLRPARVVVSSGAEGDA